MKVGAKVSVFNFEMLNRRKEMGLSQARLADLAGVTLANVICIERLNMPPASFSTIRENLNKIAFALDCPFETLFPPDYLEMIEQAKLPSRRKPVYWVRELKLNELPPNAEVLQLPSPEELVTEKAERSQLVDMIQSALTILKDREYEVVRMRYGFAGESPKTYEEIGQYLGITREGARHIDMCALRRMRKRIVPDGTANPR